MPYITNTFGLQVPSPSTKFKDLGAELKQLGEDIDAVLTSFDYNGSDPDLVVSRVNQLETRAADLELRADSIEGRLDAIETMTMTEYTLDGYTAGTGWMLSSVQGYRRGWLAFVYIRVTRSGSTISVPVDGNISNQNILTIDDPNFIPIRDRSTVSTADTTGGVSSYAIDASGTVQLTAVAPGKDITAGQGLSAVLVYPVQ